MIFSSMITFFIFFVPELLHATKTDAAIQVDEPMEKIESKPSWPHFSSLWHSPSFSHDWPFHHSPFHFPSFHPSNIFSGLVHTPSSSSQLREWNIHTPMDIKETDKSYEVSVEMPGIKKEDINVSVKNHIMTISAEKKSQERKDDEKYHRVERFYGKTSRSFTLPPHVQKEDVIASYTDGVLHLTIPKKDATCGDEVKIQIQ